MDVAHIELTNDDLTFSLSGGRFVVPCGAAALSTRHFTSDPPQPEDLTNAIGEVVDHLDDALRELPDLAGAAVVVTGVLAGVIAAVELGHAQHTSSFTLTRDAAEDVFRTLATENRADRKHNPGLPGHYVDSIVGACCAMVGVMRGLQLSGLEIKGEERQ